MDLKAHPLADLVPAPTEKEYSDLRDDIGSRGQLEPIVLLGGLILDGRTRYRACTELKCQPQTIIYDPSIHGIDPAAYVISQNMMRRHMSVAQRAATVVKLKQAAAQAGTALNVEAVAKAAGVSVTAVSMAEAAEKAEPGSIKRMEKGEKITAVAKEVSAKASQDARGDLLAERAKELSKPLRKAVSAGQALATASQLKAWLELDMDPEEKTRLEPLILDGLSVQSAVRFEDGPVGQADPMRDLLRRALIHEDGKYTDVVTDGPAAKSRVRYRITVECYTEAVKS